MSNPAPRRVALDFVANNADAFAAQLEEITVRYGKLVRVAPELATAIKNSGLSIQQQTANLDLNARAVNVVVDRYSALKNAATITDEAIKQMLASLKEANKVQTLSTGAVKFSPAVNTPQAQAETELSAMFSRIQKANEQAVRDTQAQGDAEIRLAVIKRNYTQALQLNIEAQNEEGISVERLNKLKQQQAQIENQLAGKPTNPLQEARGARDALFAFGLALNLVVSELGSQLPPAAQKAASGIKIVADSMLAGAYFGEGLGAVIGALAGILLTVGASALTVDPQIKALNDSLDKLGKKDDAAQGLAKLAGISDKNAAAALEYLKANDQFGDSFQKLVQNAQPSIPVLQGIGDAARAAGDAYHDFFQTLQDGIPAYKQWHDFLAAEPALLAQVNTYNETYAKVLRETGSVVLAATAASKAQQEAVVTSANAQAKATNDLAKAARAYADIQNEINNVTNRVAAQSAQETIAKLRLEGASVDELDLQYLKLLQDKQKAEGEQPSFNGARVYAASPIGIPQADAARKAAENDYSFLNDLAVKAGHDLLKVQAQYNTDSENLDVDHGTRLLEIDSNAYTQQLRIEREFGQRKKAIQDQYDQDITDARADFKTRSDELEANAGESRNKIAQDYADRRAKIEQDYQDKVAQIQSDYQLALFDIGQRFDANGLVRARLQREKALKDAEKQRDRDNTDAQKSRDKAQKELEDSLAKQKKTLQDEFDRKIRDLGQRFDKENAANNQNYQDQITDLVTNTTNLRNAEDAEYKKRKRQLDDQLKERKQSIIDSLDETLQKTKDKEEEYARAIIESLRSILDPTTIAELLNDLQKSLDAKIEIKVTPFNANTDTTVISPIARPHASGAYIAQNEYAYLHAGETVLPRDPVRAYELAAQHMERVQMPMGTRSASYAGSGGKVYLYVDNSLNSTLLNSQIRVESIGVTTEIIKRGMR